MVNIISEISKEILGESLFIDLENFFKNIINKVRKKEANVLIFISRKASSLFMLYSKIVEMEKDLENVLIINDKAIYFEKDILVNENKKILIIDDNIFKGNAIYELCQN